MVTLTYRDIIVVEKRATSTSTKRWFKAPSGTFQIDPLGTWLIAESSFAQYKHPKVAISTYDVLNQLYLQLGVLIQFASPVLTAEPVDWWQ